MKYERKRKSISYSAVKLIMLTLAVLFIQSMAQAQNPTPLEQQCMTAVQGKVAYNRAGQTGWGVDNLRNLCKGTTNPNATITCFQSQIATHDDWRRGIAACKSKPVSAPVEIIAIRADRPINEYTWLGSHNATASYAYGYSTQNSQRYSVTTQLDGGVRMLEIDIVHDTPDDKQPAGVYICHCGEAAHSYSNSEKQRAKNLKSPIPLPAWSTGVTYTRFSTILKEIDAWLLKRPNEVVFIMPENNSATAAQFDAEVAVARLSTRTYLKPDSQKYWPSRQELISSNQRLVILAADGQDLTGSKYANKKGFIAWKGYITPAMYGSKNDYQTAAGEEDKFLTLGSFRSTPTDAITARYYNDYDELNKRKAEWVKKGITRFPTFIQVNQVQVGDALRFVNELNDITQQITSTMPKDPAGDWIVTASADIGTGVVKAATVVGDGIVNTITGGPTTPGSRSITFNNQAGYVAKMTVVYFMTETIGGTQVPIAKALSTPTISVGFSRPLEIPRNTAKGLPISVVIEGVGTIKGKVLETTVAESFTGNVCFKSWGTIFDAKGGPCK